jgi:hypothetical protein
MIPLFSIRKDLFVTIKRIITPAWSSVMAMFKEAKQVKTNIEKRHTALLNLKLLLNLVLSEELHHL